MSNVSDIYDLWLKAIHLPAGKVVNVTIQRAEIRTIHPQPTTEKQAIILTFVGKSRKLILNPTNANRLVELGGEDFMGWQGLVISLKRQSYTKNKETIVIGPATNEKQPEKIEPEPVLSSVEGSENNSTEPVVKFPGNLLNEAKQKGLIRLLKEEGVAGPETFIRSVFGVNLADMTDITAKNIIELAKRTQMFNKQELTAEQLGYGDLPPEAVPTALLQETKQKSRDGQRWADAETLLKEETDGVHS